MAFVYKAERKIVLADNEGARTQNLGPGSYQVIKGNSKQFHSRPPFLTQTGRTGKAANEEMRRSADFQGIEYNNQNQGATAQTFNQARNTVTGSRPIQQYAAQAAQFAGYTPGPGSYNISNGFDQIQRDMQSAKTLQGFGLDQFGIQFVKPHTSFASRVKRFQGSELGPKNEVPGPGQYYQSPSWVKQQKFNNQGGKGMTNALLPNPPSIPSHNNVFGYEENVKGELIRQKNTELVHTGENNDKVGPGDYEIDMKKTTKGPTKWFKSQSQARITKLNQQPPGPGHYQPPISAINPIYKNNKSSVFASKVNRNSASANGRSRVKVIPGAQSAAQNATTSNKYQAIATAAASPLKSGGGMQDVLESDEEEQVPGPGRYHDGFKSDFKPETRPQRLQFFGSTVERFTEPNRFKVNDEIGPGKYPVAETAFTTKKVKYAGVNPKAPQALPPKVGFGAGQSRFQTDSRSTKAAGLRPSMANSMKMITPGPGHYEDNKAIDQQFKSQKGKNGTFGCTERRFAPKQGANTGASGVVQNTPGPGQYIQSNLEQIKAEEIKRSSSMFISKTKRNSNYYNNVKKTKLNPGLENVQYDDKTNTIADTVRKRVDQINNPLLASLTNKNNTTMAFSSNAPRFNQKLVDEETYIGPGYYEQKSCFEKSRSTMAKSTKTGGMPHGHAGAQSGQGLNNARSMQQIMQQNQPQYASKLGATQAAAGKPGGPQSAQAMITPGPGHYSQPNLNAWFKRSYNMNFSEV